MATAVAIADVKRFTVGELRRWTEERLARAEVPSPPADAAALVARACGWRREDLAKRTRDVVGYAAVRRLAGLTARRCKREPLQLIVGSAPFLGFIVAVGPGVFIPRPETEGLALAAEMLVAGMREPVILDLFAGSGPLAIYLAARRPDARVVAVEVDATAAALIDANASAHRRSVEVIIGDVMDEGVVSRLPRADLIVANPPYIETAAIPALPPEVRDWEAKRALDGGADGLTFYPRIAALAVRLLSAAGAVAVEIGENQAGAVAEIFGRVGDVEVGRDLAGRERYLWARRTGGR
ncbi:MAG: peptide chain release factor N(5)-glutamine methyltransferase [candidate division Zixibacteria bacterium]|nr:peptide chain release factor N(5)-glutamine methyltransferase [candidate division Zixibacteria bacterium]